jgi:hypothetical protein
MRIMYILLLLIVLGSMFLAKEGGEKLQDSPYILEKVPQSQVGYEVDDTTQVWRVAFIFLRYGRDMTDKELDSLYYESFVCMDQFIFYANLEDIIPSNISSVEDRREGKAISFLFSVPKTVTEEQLLQILENSFFGTPMKKADACRLFPF